MALVLNSSTVRVTGGWPDDRCGYTQGRVPQSEMCNGTRQTPEQYAFDKLRALMAWCNDSSFCPVSVKANCFTSREDAWRKNAMWLRVLAQHGTTCGKVSMHNQMMSKWQVSDITAVAYSPRAAEDAQEILNFIHSMRTSMGLPSQLRLVEFDPGMGACVADCCVSASTPSQEAELRKLVAQTPFKS